MRSLNAKGKVITLITELKIAKRPPEVVENLEAFKWVDGAWMRITDLADYYSSMTRKEREAINLKWPSP